MIRPILLALLVLAGGPAGRPALAQDADAGAISKDPTQVRAGRYVLDTAHGKITWSISHLGFSTYYGQFTDVSGELALDPREPGKSALSVRIGTGSANALDERLNAHMKKPEFFDVDKFPQANFVSTSVEPSGPTTARVTGDLTLKGITKPVSFDATFNQAGLNPVDKKYTVGFDGWAVIKRSEFGVSAFLPALGDEVSLRLEGEFKAME